MNRRFLSSLILFGLCLFVSCNDDDADAELKEVLIQESFESGENGWEAVFAAYPEGEEEFYELASGVAPLPNPLDQSQNGFMLSGNNHSDALQMMFSKQIEGLLPDHYYQVHVELKIASQYPKNSVGIGGSPGSAVHLVANACRNGYELLTNESEGSKSAPMVILNIKKDDEDNEAQSIADLGNVGKDTEEFTYELIERQNEEPLVCKTDGSGKLWILIGTWSGFEGITTLYYDEVRLTFIPN